MMAAAPVASAAMTMTPWIQYSQPMMAPALGPMALVAYTEKDPDEGFAAAISPSMFMIRMTRKPARAKARMMPGPATATACPEPMNSPAPMAPPRPIMVICRVFRLAAFGAVWVLDMGGGVRAVRR